MTAPAPSRHDAPPSGEIDAPSSGDAVAVDGRTRERPGAIAAAESWDQGRWQEILDRIEYRQGKIGLRFWGPPLWLEVTMSGPDSDAWSVAGAGGLPDRSWDWQSNAVCDEAMGLAAAGADDDRLLSVVSRYTLDNLVLNATHEIGEWLRFDARRLFAPHGERAPGPAGSAPSEEGDTQDTGTTPPDGVQGNGAVQVTVRFDADVGVGTDDVDPGHDGRAAQQVTDRAADLAAPWRFSYLPGTSIGYDRDGPTVTVTVTVTGTRVPVTTAGERGEIGTTFGCPWSAATLKAVAAPDGELVDAVTHDVHAMLVRYETRRVCEAFFVDGHRPWRLESSARPATPDTAEPGARPLHVEITYEHRPTARMV